jgi:hypothetical protein
MISPQVPVSVTALDRNPCAIECRSATAKAATLKPSAPALTPIFGNAIKAHPKVRSSAPLTDSAASSFKHTCEPFVSFYFYYFYFILFFYYFF